MPVYRLSNAAIDDLIAIYVEGIELFGATQADRYNRSLEKTFAFLADYPHAARMREEIDPPVRAHPHKSHIIVYDSADDGVTILRVRHSREDWIASPEG